MISHPLLGQKVESWGAFSIAKQQGKGMSACVVKPTAYRIKTEFD
jgi:hypothetical protein